MEVSERSSRLAALLGAKRAHVSVRTDGISLTVAGSTEVIAYPRLRLVGAERHWPWASFVCVTTDGAQRTLRGFKRRAARTLVDAAVLLSRDAETESLLREFDAPRGRDVYLTHSMHAKWLKYAAARVEGAGSGAVATNPEWPASARLKRLQGLVVDAERGREHRNVEHCERMARKHSGIFGAALGYALNKEQVAAIVHDEDRSLVVAGAGTGKTSAVVGKVAYLLEEGLAKPEEILLLAFTRKAADEMRERLDRLRYRGVDVSTFHALGTKAIAHATGAKPSVSKLAEDDHALARALTGYVDSLLREAPGQAVREFLLRHRYPLRPLESFPTPHHHHQHVAGHDVRTLRGERVKSVQECLIADWLTAHGIRYEYEAPYEHPTASIEYRQYHPDFYLPDHGVYIEHFGVGRNQRPAPCVGDAGRYLAGMQWKRALHKERKTKLVETYSYQAFEGTLFFELQTRLKALGVAVAPLPPEEIAAVLAGEQVIEPFVRLLSSFLSLFKSNDWTLDEVRSRLAKVRDPRASAFLDAFELIRRRYEDQLAAEGAIDFSDMIARATRFAEAGKFAPGYRYVLIDEFQDISRGRARLVQALLKQVRESKLFAVGDDWQSIYRFTGSDIDLMVRFPDHFGFTRRTDLRQTHRFNKELLDASSRFVLANPQQLSKQLIASESSGVPAIEVISISDAASSASTRTNGDRLAADKDDAVRLGVQRAFEAIAEESRDPSIDVLLLGRYSFVAEAAAKIRPADSRIALRPMTVHKAKGLEADYVIVADVVGGRYGFPTEIVDDPLLELVLAGAMAVPNAEERRLFYVALTRARRKTFLLTHDSRRSVFIDELESAAYTGLVIASGARGRTVSCPSCQGGRLLRRTGEWGQFWGCSNYPQCEQKARLCPWCGSGAFVRRSGSYECADQQCRRAAPVCPRCQIGAVVPRTGKFGPFMGCTEWRSSGPSCDYTRKR